MQLRDISGVFTSIDSNHAEVKAAAVTAFKLFYSSPVKLPMEKIRYNKYMELASQGVIAPEKLPPTEESAYYHGLRVHLQIMDWLLLEASSFDPLEWGWDNVGGCLVPITNRLDIAPSSLSKLIRCSCKLTSKNPCGSRLCTCVKYGMPCLPSCSDCRGEECNNRKDQRIADEAIRGAEDEIRDYGNIFDIMNSEFCSDTDNE